MTAKLHMLESNTIFSYNGMEWEKGNLEGRPSKGTPDVVFETIGKSCVKCYPKLGGRFQHQLGKWIPIETVVSID